MAAEPGKHIFHEINAIRLTLYEHRPRCGARRSGSRCASACATRVGPQSAGYPYGYLVVDDKLWNETVRAIFRKFQA